MLVDLESIRNSQRTCSYCIQGQQWQEWRDSGLDQNRLPPKIHLPNIQLTEFKSVKARLTFVQDMLDIFVIVGKWTWGLHGMEGKDLSYTPILLGFG